MEDIECHSMKRPWIFNGPWVILSSKNYMHISNPSSIHLNISFSYQTGIEWYLLSWNCSCWAPGHQQQQCWISLNYASKNFQSPIGQGKICFNILYYLMLWNQGVNSQNAEQHISIHPRVSGRQCIGVNMFLLYNIRYQLVTINWVFSCYTNSVQ